MTSDMLLDLIVLLDGAWRPVTATELWGRGLDYGEDEREGRALELLERGPVFWVRVTWTDGHSACRAQTVQAPYAFEHVQLYRWTFCEREAGYVCASVSIEREVQEF